MQGHKVILKSPILKSKQMLKHNKNNKINSQNEKVQRKKPNKYRALT